LPLNPLLAIFRTNLGVRRTERVLVFTDRPARGEAVSPADALRRERLRDIANMAAETGRPLCKELVFVVYPATGANGKEPPPSLWRAAFGERAVGELEKARLMGPLLKKKISPEQLARAEAIVRKNRRHAVEAVVGLANYSTSHTGFRHFLTRICGARFASMPLFDPSMLEGAMDVDWKALAKRTLAVARVVRKAVEVEITTPHGTKISFSTRGRKVQSDTGILTRAGAFGNLPAGEVFLAPVEGTAQGRLVLLWGPTRRLGSPVTLDVKDGLVAGVIGEDEYARELSRKLDERAENRNIAELGIGTNDRASRPDNILESEKILGTVHIALGDNSSFGGRVKAPFHQDFVFFQPTVVLAAKDGKKIILLDGGRLLGA